MTRAPSDPRAAALDLLGAVLRRGRPLEAAFDEAAGGLAGRDRAFVRALAATAIRRLGQIDDALSRLMDRPPEAARVRDALRLGAAQILFLGTPPHAAVDATVRLAGRQRAQRGLVNAVLRRLAREGTAILAGQDAARLNTPDWLWRSWVAAYGAETARAVALADLKEAPLDLSVKSDTAAWAAALGAAILPWGSLRRPAGGAVEDLPGYGEGAWWVQDAAAALPARLLLGALPGPVAETPVVDLCAAPGGKTAQLAAAGARVTAVDRSPARCDLLRANLARLGLNADVVAADAAAWRPAVPVPAVLLDAPCSATGTLRRHPDVAHNKGPDDVAKLTALQDRLLRAAVEMLAPGGTLVYAVCSVQPEEGPARIAALLEGGTPLDRVPVRPDEVGGMAEKGDSPLFPDLITAEGDLRTLPCHLADQGGLDGFYACRLRRIA